MVLFNFTGRKFAHFGVSFTQNQPNHTIIWPASHILNFRAAKSRSNFYAKPSKRWSAPCKRFNQVNFWTVCFWRSYSAIPGCTTPVCECLRGKSQEAKAILLFPFVLSFYIPISLRYYALHHYITGSLFISHAYLINL